MTELVEISPGDPVFARLIEARHRRYRRSTTGGIQDEILELWEDLRDLKLTIAEVRS